jgi:hypothetical protein
MQMRRIPGARLDCFFSGGRGIRRDVPVERSDRRSRPFRATGVQLPHSLNLLHPEVFLPRIVGLFAPTQNLGTLVAGTLEVVRAMTAAPV